MGALRGFLTVLALASLVPTEVVQVGADDEVPALHRGIPEAIPIVLPDDSHTRLEIQEEGIEALRRIKGPIATVVVIGPFRSGKSFVLNQMLGLSCDKGFSVGHRRHAQTKGIWFWGEPQRITVDDGTHRDVNIIYVDTEGFEAAGKADVYDDRVFALSALLSTVLVYNLPETVKEADIEKLQFAVELADEFAHRALDEEEDGHEEEAGEASPSSPAVVGSRRAFEIPSLLWLIQRDFLMGRSVAQMVDDALEPVPNAENDPSVERVNYIRNYLKSTAKNYEAIGLCQPHLNRTSLCELGEKAFDPRYLQQRNQLRRLVKKLVLTSAKGPKRLMNGGELALHLKKLVSALNKGEIPSVRSVTDHFNAEIIRRAVDKYQDQAKIFKLPMSDEVLKMHHSRLQDVARQRYLREKFGRDVDTTQLDRALQQKFEWVMDRNRLRSKEECERLYMQCDDLMEMLQLMSLPSLLRFDSVYNTQCNTTFEETCVGPSKDSYRQRIHKQYSKERTRFVEAYNQKLLNGVTLGCLLGVIIFRFIWVMPLLELVAWAGFLFLELYLKTQSMIFSEHDHPYWKKFVSIWEVAVFNQLYDLNSFVHVLIPGLTVLVVLKSGQKCWAAASEYYCVRILARLLMCIFNVVLLPVRPLLRYLSRCFSYRNKDSLLPFYSYKDA